MSGDPPAVGAEARAVESGVDDPLRDVEYKYAVGARNYALLLVNGDPPIIDVDDLKKLDKHGMEQDGIYQLL